MNLDNMIIKNNNNSIKKLVNKQTSNITKKNNKEGFDNVINKNKMDIQTLLDLQKQYLKILSDYSTQQKLLMSKSNDYINKQVQQNNELGKNVYVSNYGNSSDLYEYNGCYNDSNTILKLQTDMGTGVTLNNCQLRAYDTNNNIFALKGTPTKCYVGKNLDTLKAETLQPLKFTTTWSSPTISSSSKGGLTTDGRFAIFTNDENNPTWTQTYWSENPTTNNISYIQLMDSRGRYILAKPDNSGVTMGEGTDPGTLFQMINNPNGSVSFKTYYNTYLRADSNPTIVNQTDSPSIWESFILKPYISDTTDYFNIITYHNTNLYAPPTSGQPFQQSKINNDENSRFKIINVPTIKQVKLVMQDDGNLVVYNNKNAPIWASNTCCKPLGISNPQHQASKGKNGRNYLMNDETLKIGEFIGSNTGNCYLILTKTGFELRNDLELPTTTSCTSSNNIYTTNDQNENMYAIYKSNKNISNPINLFDKVGYLADNGEINEYPQTMIKPNNTYREIGNYNNIGNDIKIISSKSPEECMTGCNNVSGCEGFVYNTSGTCNLKNSNMYPKTLRIPTNGSSVLYKRNVKINSNNTCSSNVINITPDDWNNYSKGNIMTPSTLCNLGNYTNKDQLQVKETLQRLNEIAIQIYNKLQGLSSESKAVLREYGLTEEKIKQDIKNFPTLLSQKKTFINNYPTSLGMEKTSEIEKNINNSSFIASIILAIIIIGGAIKILK